MRVGFGHFGVQVGLGQSRDCGLALEPTLTKTVQSKQYGALNAPTSLLAKGFPQSEGRGSTVLSYRDPNHCL